MPNLGQAFCETLNSPEQQMSSDCFFLFDPISFGSVPCLSVQSNYAAVKGIFMLVRAGLKPVIFRARSAASCDGAEAVFKINLIFWSGAGFRSQLHCYTWQKQKIFVFMGAESPTVSLGRRGLPLIPPPPWEEHRERSSPSPQTGSPIKRGSCFYTSQWRRGQPSRTRSGASLMTWLCAHTHTHTQQKAHNYCKHTERFWLRRRLNFWLLAPSLLTFDPSLEGKTPQSPPQDQVRGRRPRYISVKPERVSQSAIQC